MKRLPLLVLVVALAAIAAAAVAPVPAKAAVPCRDRIYNDWYPDGKIKTTYPISCYRDALKHIKADALAYSSLADDIRSAMQAALARQHGHKSVPAQVGKGGPAEPQQVSHSSTSSKPRTSSSTDSSSSGPQQVSVSQTLPTSTVASGQTGGGGGIPVPLLVLGGLALLLVAVGAAGLVAKRRRDTA